MSWQISAFNLINDLALSHSSYILILKYINLHLGRNRDLCVCVFKTILWIENQRCMAKKFRLCLDRDLCDLLDKNIIFAPSYLNKNTYGWNQVFFENIKVIFKIFGVHVYKTFKIWYYLDHHKIYGYYKYWIFTFHLTKKIVSIIYETYTWPSNNKTSQWARIQNKVQLYKKINCYWYG